MRILYFTTSYVTHDHRFLKSISEGGHEVFYVRLENISRQVEDRSVPPNVQQVVWKGGREPFRWGKLPALVMDFRRLVNEIKPDIIHAGPIQTCAFIAILSGFRPVLTMSWGFDLMDDVHKSKWMQFVTRFTLKRSTFFTSDAKVTRDKAIEYGMNPEKTIVFPWGIDLDRFKPKKTSAPKTKSKARTAKAKPRHEFILFCNRSWEKRYGVDVLARAFVKVTQTDPKVNLILLGGGSQGGAIRQILNSGGVMDRVHFGGQVAQKDLPYWYHQADLYISPSHVDGSSVSLMEALGCGLPCLVSDIPANKEWVNDSNGWLFRDGDVNDLAEKILLAIKSKRSLAKIGKASRATAEDRADWNKNAKKLMQTYQTIVKSK